MNEAEESILKGNPDRALKLIARARVLMAELVNKLMPD